MGKFEYDEEIKPKTTGTTKKKKKILLGAVLIHFVGSVVHYVDILRTCLQQGALSGEGKLERIKVQLRISLLCISTKVFIACCLVTV